MIKTLLTVFIFLTSICSAQSFKIFNGDTINVVDQNKKKQGLWIFFNKNYVNQIAQKGYFKNGLKDSTWTTYYPNGNIKSIITYKNNRQYGPVKIFYPNGNIQEEGFWKYNKWIGEYKFYYENGQIKYHWFFDKNGKRTGTQTYYYENGKKQIEGKWNNGKKSGEITEYYQNGQIAKIANFKNGKIEGSITEYYANGQLKSRIIYANGEVTKQETYAYTPPDNKNTENKIISSSKDSTSKDYKVFTGNGFYQFLDKKGRVEREGTFKNGILVDGKRYFYDNKDNVIKIAIIKNGRITKIIYNQKQK